MSIRLRLFVGSIVFALLTATFGFFSYNSQVSSLELIRQLYSNGMDPLSRLQQAKSNVDTLRARFESGIEKKDSSQRFVAEGPQLEDLLVNVSALNAEIGGVLSADLSEPARKMLRSVLYPLSLISTAQGHLSDQTVLRELKQVSLGIGEAVQIVHNDMVGMKSDADDSIHGAMILNGIAIASVILALSAFFVFLSRSVGGALRRLVDTARALAAGQLDMPIVPTGPREVRNVLAALVEMQDRCEFLETTLAEKTDLLSGQLAVQQDQLAAALNNMTQALCMLDGQKRLVVCNEVFGEYFGNHAAGTPGRKIFDDPRLTAPLQEHETAVHLHEMESGAVMEVKRRGMPEKGLLITFEDITEKQQIAKRLEHLAGHDGLTDLPNRRCFGEDLDELLLKSRGPFTVAVLDIRNFKSINDTYGHPIGDALLKECGRRLVELAGPRATVARLGGDEFAIIAPAARSPEDSLALGEKILADFEAPFEVEERRIFASASIGLVHTSPAKGVAGEISADIILQNCDLALYKAKEDRRGAYRIFQPSMRQKLKQRREMELDLQVALDKGQFELFYQPFVDAEEGRVSGFEALLRWRHPEKGMISPSLFIPLAEETGLIEKLGVWGLETACRQAAGWPTDMAVSVNLSAVQFKSPTLLTDVARVLSTSGLAPSRLQIEVTESLFLDESDRVLSILSEFRRRGLTISMDDFGTGYSSLGYLSRFPFDKIKIDQSFVRDMARPENIAIVRSVIGLSRALGMKVIAEGIETAEQMQVLYDEGCREMQGYFFSRPRPAGDLPLMLSEIANRWDGEFSAFKRERRRGANAA
ncbi:EAL domain-containing protein [Jiella sp. M17.18]|uniref:EAL domain-containing protein n=1 Tax=Jiella sp. M17.18 TaxID=3234247 RepID=UPI0034DEBA00